MAITENCSDSLINSKGFGEFPSSKIQGSRVTVAYSHPKIHRIPLGGGGGGGELGYIGKESMCPNKSFSTSFQVKKKLAYLISYLQNLPVDMNVDLNFPGAL